MKKSEEAVLDVAKQMRDSVEVGEDGKEILVLSTGVRIYYKPVNAALFTDVLAKMEPPEAPEVYIDTKGRYEKNPSDPTYLAQMDNWQQERANALMETFAIFGVELVDGLPEDSGWLKQLQMLDRLGRMDLSKFDLEDELDLKFLYIKNIAFGSEDWGAVFKAFNMTREGVASAQRNFQRPAAR